jgi:hypothetical protein
MEKILLALDATNLNTHAIDFACYLGALTNSKITGVFLENLVNDDKLVPRELMYDSSHSNWQADKSSESDRKKKETIEKNILFFKKACERRSAGYIIHLDNGDPVKEVITESRYADILIADAETSFSKKFEGTPTAFVKDILKGIECPVIIAPETFEEIDEIVFTCNGSKSSMFAIKQFCHLFPQLNEKKVSLLQVEEENSGPVDDRERLKEWLSSHYSSIGFITLIGDTETELLGYLLRKKNAFIVMGAYSRSMLSEIFKPSHADRLIQTLNQAIFIAHC